MPQSHTAGWTSESPTPAQLAEFFRQIKSGRITKARLQPLLQGDILLVTVGPLAGFLALIDAGGYDGKYIDSDFTEADLPLFSNRSEDREISLRKRDATTTTQQWLDSLDLNQESIERFAHPLAVAAIGVSEEHRDEQREAPIFTIWKSSRSGRLWYLILVGVAGYRNVRVRRGDPVGEWGASYRAAVVAK